MSSEAQASVSVIDLPIARRVGSLRSTGVGLAIEHLGCAYASTIMADSDPAAGALVIPRHRPGRALRVG